MVTQIRYSSYLKAKNSSFIFVGFASISCHSLDSHVNDSNALVFGFTNKDGQPMKNEN
jgi:hypothetical protein